MESRILATIYFPFCNGAKFVQAVVTMVHRILQQHPENQVLHKVADDFQNGTPVKSRSGGKGLDRLAASSICPKAVIDCGRE